MVYVTARRGVELHADQAGVDAGGHLRVREQLRLTSAPSLGHTARSVLVGPGRRYGRRRVRLEGRLAVAEHPGVARHPRRRLVDVRFELFASMPWWELRPPAPTPGGPASTLIAGAGARGASWTTSPRRSRTDGEWLLAYVPDHRAGRTDDHRRHDGAVRSARARWFDPATGNYLAIARRGATPISGTQEFTTPGQRGDGNRRLGARARRGDDIAVRHDHVDGPVHGTDRASRGRHLPGHGDAPRTRR